MPSAFLWTLSSCHPPLGPLLPSWYCQAIARPPLIPQLSGLQGVTFFLPGQHHPAAPTVGPHQLCWTPQHPPVPAPSIPSPLPSLSPHPWLFLPVMRLCHWHPLKHKLSDLQTGGGSPVSTSQSRSPGLPSVRVPAPPSAIPNPPLWEPCQTPPTQSLHSSCMPCPPHTFSLWLPRSPCQQPLPPTAPVLLFWNVLIFPACWRGSQPSSASQA